jgi:hypothetical protein
MCYVGGHVFVLKRMSHVVEEMIPRKPLAPEEIKRPPRGISRRDWERLTDEQRANVVWMYDAFKSFAEALGARPALTGHMISVLSDVVSKKVGAWCQVYRARVSGSSVGFSDEFKREYVADGSRSEINASATYVKDMRIGVRCHIGKDKEGRDVAVDMSVPADAVNYAVNVSGDHESVSELITCVLRVKSEEPLIRVEAR